MSFEMKLRFGYIMLAISTMLAAFLSHYAYKLFAWDDILPLSLYDIMYMIPFTVEHVLLTIIQGVMQ